MCGGKVYTKKEKIVKKNKEREDKKKKRKKYAQVFFFTCRQKSLQCSRLSSITKWGFRVGVAGQRGRGSARWVEAKRVYIRESHGSTLSRLVFSYDRKRSCYNGNVARNAG